MSDQKNTSPLPPEATALERRVLAHERILQSLLAYMSRNDPRFVEYLQSRFVLPMSRVSHEHDYKETDEYAEDFIRAVMLLEAKGRSSSNKTKPNKSISVERRTATVPERAPYAERIESSGRVDRVQLVKKNSIWEISVDGVFRGHYHDREHALAAEALATLSLS
ncbi:hypothetical protein [Thalassospira sp.]|uniref:hypothetical protein n=1 Tax=Thalassospira sp. TaxID=1912094 RepID=UPI003AA7E362